MFDPGPALADRMQDELGARAVGDVSRRQVDHEQAPVGIDGDVALAPDDLLSRVIAAPFGPWRLYRLAVDHTRGRLRGTPRPKFNSCAVISAGPPGQAVDFM